MKPGRKETDKGQQQVAREQVALTRLDAQIQQASGADTRRKDLVALRRKHYVDVFGQIVGEEEVLQGLYAPLSTRLKDASGALAKLAFVVQRQVDLDSWCKKGEDLFTFALERGSRAMVRSRSTP